MNSPLKKPAALCKGDSIGVMAPASPVKKELLHRGVDLLVSLGYNVRIHPQTYMKSRYYTAGPDKERAAALTELIEDDEIKAIFLARGGYGSIRLLEMLDPGLSATSKIVVGSSDATSILLYLVRKCSIVAFHGPMPAGGIAAGKADLGQLVKLISGEGRPEPFRNLTVLHSGSATGYLTGGCLSLVTATIGTPFEIETEGSILFLEDTGVKPYQIDRMIMTLKLAGKLDGINGLIFGEMTNCAQHRDQGYSSGELLSKLTAEFGVPVMMGLSSGHTEKKELTLPLGCRVSMESGTLELLEKAVS